MPTRVLNKVVGGGDGIIYGGDERFFVEKKAMVSKDEEDGKIGLVKNICCSDESSSSIGKNSDLSEEKSGGGGGGGGDGEEVQSSYNGPLASMEALEEVLPMRRGISRFYKGKSKSFASLGEVAAASSSSIGKPENAYMRKRRNVVASGSPLSLRANGGGVAKRVASSRSSRATVALAVAIGNSPSTKDLSSRPWRSFSLADFQQLR